MISSQSHGGKHSSLSSFRLIESHSNGRYQDGKRSAFAGGFNIKHTPAKSLCDFSQITGENRSIDPTHHTQEPGGRVNAGAERVA